MFVNVADVEAEDSVESLEKSYKNVQQGSYTDRIQVFKDSADGSGFRKCSVVCGSKSTVTDNHVDHEQYRHVVCEY